MLHVRKELADYINTPLTYNENGDLMYHNMSIMNEFERPLIQHIAKTIVHRGGSVLNIGYGLGIFDKKVEEIGVRIHTIMECHPNVVASIDIPTATIYVGPWQEHIDALIENGQKYDCVFFDTYMFNKNCLDDEWFLFMKYADKLLNKYGKISMFNWFKDGVEVTQELKDGMKHLKLHEETYEINGHKYKHLYWEKEDEQNRSNVKESTKEN
tara:strand:+ start:42 stop:677 length:636 start_codon:yes stop_codon:yes gene_type:complete